MVKFLLLSMLCVPASSCEAGSCAGEDVLMTQRSSQPLDVEGSEVGDISDISKVSLLQVNLELAHVHEEVHVGGEGQVGVSGKTLESCPLQSYLTGMPRRADALLELPEEIFGTDSLIDFLNNKIESAQEKASKDDKFNVILDVFAASADGSQLHDLGEDMGIDACENMEVVKNTDVAAFGYWKKADGSSFCTAFNPCDHTYALAQVGILPNIPLSTTPQMEASVDVVAFSLEKQLHTTSFSKLWDGSSLPAKLGVDGHAFIQGTLTLGIELHDDLSLEVSVECKMIMDMDPGNDGVFSPFAKGNKRQTDFAFMLSGIAKPVLHLPDGKELDLGGLITASADLYVMVQGAGTTFQFGASISRNLGKICDASPALDLLCAVFEEDTGITGNLLMFADFVGFGLRVEVNARFGLKSDFLEDLLNFPADVSINAGLQLTYYGKKPNVCVDWNGNQVCFGNCKKNSDCEDTKFCDTVFKVCAKKRRIGGKCGQDVACKSGHCVLGFCRECEGQGDCPDSNKYCTDPTSLNGPSQCQTKKNNGWGICTRDYQCKNYCKGGFCRQCEENRHCPSGKYCTDQGSCTTPRNNGWGICTKDYQCRNVCSGGICKDCRENSHCGSGRYCNDRKECKSKRPNGWRVCSKGSQCSSGRCSWGACKSR